MTVAAAKYEEWLWCLGTMRSCKRCHSYPAVLQSLMDEECLVMNFGAPGSTMTRSAAQSYWNSESYKRLLYHSQDGRVEVTIVLFFGTNDAKKVQWDLRVVVTASREASA